MTSEVKIMEIKKQEQLTRANPEPAFKKMKVREWIEEMKKEIRIIHWTSGEELRIYTKIVVGATFFFGMGVYLVDLTIHNFLLFLTWISRFLIG